MRLRQMKRFTPFEDYNEDDYGQYIKNSDGSYNLDIVNSGAKPYFDKYTWDPRFSHTIVAPGQPWKYDPDLFIPFNCYS